MRQNIRWLCLSVALVFLLAGCGPLLVGGAAAGTGAGTYYFVNGALQADYKYPFDKVWGACEKTMADLRALNVRPAKEIGQGVLLAEINTEKVRLEVKYKERNVTTVAIRIGFFGDNTASRMIADKIEDNIAKN